MVPLFPLKQICPCISGHRRTSEICGLFLGWTSGRTEQWSHFQLCCPQPSHPQGGTALPGPRCSPPSFFCGSHSYEGCVGSLFCTSLHFPAWKVLVFPGTVMSVNGPGPRDSFLANLVLQFKGNHSTDETQHLNPVLYKAVLDLGDVGRRMET